MPRLTHLLAAISVLGCLLVPAPSAAQSGKTLRWRMREGEDLRVEFQQTSDQLMHLANRQVRTLTEMKMYLGWSVQDVNDEAGATIMQTIDRLTMKLDVRGGDSIQFDSASDQPHLGAAASIAGKVQPIIGAKLDMTMSPRGEIVAGELPPQLRRSVPSNPDHPFARLLSEESMRDVLGQSVIVFPEAQLNPGDTWTQSVTMPSPVGGLQQLRTYTYTGTNDDDGRAIEHIQVDTRLRIDPSSPQATKLKMTHHAQTGTVSFDAQLGRVVRSTQSQEMTTETPYRDTTIRITTKSTSVTTIKLADEGANP